MALALAIFERVSERIKHDVQQSTSVTKSFTCITEVESSVTNVARIGTLRYKILDQELELILRQPSTFIAN